MKGIIFTDWEGVNLVPLTNIYPEPLFPLGDRPAIDYLLMNLRLAGIDEVLIVLNRRMDDLARYLGDGKGLGIRIDYICQNLPLGRGGVIREAAGFLDDKPLLLLDSSVVIDFDLRRLFDFHKERGSCLTIGVKNETPPGLKLSGDGRVDLIYKGDIDFRGSGINILDPSILHFISGSGYLDIEDQLLPSLLNKDMPVYLYRLSGYIRNIELLDDYMAVNMDLLKGRLNGIYSPKGYRREIKEGVWVGRDVDIIPDVNLIGPIIIGDNAIIGSGCQIVGPAIIGEDCHLMDEVIVKDSIILAGSYLGRGSKVESSIIGKDYHLEKGQVCQQMAIKGYLTMGEANLIHPDSRIAGNLLDGARFSLKTKRHIYLTIKRVLDIIISFFALFFGSPLFLMISLAIKINSKGPIFFIQRRCTKDGRRFSMIKFRSMIHGAEDMKNGLLSKNEADGPMFKIEDDPRLTRVGRFLRRTSLDELPQFFNALVGDMSLVGPRPLMMEEMGYSPEWREARLRVKAGITGMWQVSGRSETSFQDWIRYDIYYIKNQSLWLDLKILLKTIKAVFAGIGAR